MSNWKQVSAEEFETFVANYPTKLSYNAARMYEPPIISYNDFGGGKKWPDSMVAKYSDTESWRGTSFYKENAYFIRA